MLGTEAKPLETPKAIESLITSGNPPAEPKPAEPAKPEEKPVEPPKEAAKLEPVTFEQLKLPEGFAPVDDAVKTDFLKLVNDVEMTPQARAQALVDLQAKVLQAGSEAGTAAWDKMQEEWKAAAKADKEFGGEKLEANLASINDLLNTFADKEFRSLLNETGAGNHVSTLRFLTKVSRALAEGKLLVGSSTNVQETDLAKRMFPNMK